MAGFAHVKLQKGGMKTITSLSGSASALQLVLRLTQCWEQSKQGWLLGAAIRRELSG